MTNLEAALAYARQGWQVLPIDPTSKRPTTRNGVKDATIDERTLRAWFELHPELNLGIATGAPGPDVLDIDNLWAFGDTHDLSAFGDTPFVETARGRHYYFVGSDQRTIALGYGELRRQGSYVIAPPSTHPSGKVYSWGKLGVPMDPAPDWISEGRQSAGAGEAPVVTTVPPGEMYNHLLDLVVRLARAGILDHDARVRALQAEFDAVRVPGASYTGGPEELERLADAPSEILRREADAQLPTLTPYVSVGSWVGEEGLSNRDPSQAIGRSSKDLRASPRGQVDWLVPGFAAVGWTVLVTGREKISGKGTLITYLLSRLERGEPTVFGSPAIGPVTSLILSEEPWDSLAEKHDAFGMEWSFVVFGWELAKMRWEEKVNWLLTRAIEDGHKVIYLDNISRTAAVTNDDESGTGLARKIEPLATAAQEYGITVVIDHHNRKSGGKVEDTFRGGTALPGAVDNIVSIGREGDWTSRKRKLSSRGRVKATGWVKVIELAEDGTDYLQAEAAGDYTTILQERESWTAQAFATATGLGDQRAREILQERGAKSGKVGRADVYTINPPPEI